MLRVEPVLTDEPEPTMLKDVVATVLSHAAGGGVADTQVTESWPPFHEKPVKLVQFDGVPLESESEPVVCASAAGAIAAMPEATASAATIRPRRRIVAKQLFWVFIRFPWKFTLGHEADVGGARDSPLRSHA